VISWIRIQIRINLEMTSQNVWKMSLFEHFVKVFSLKVEPRIRIRNVRIKVKCRIRISINVTSRIRIRIKVTSRIRNRIRITHADPRHWYPNPQLFIGEKRKFDVSIFLTAPNRYKKLGKNTDQKHRKIFFVIAVLCYQNLLLQNADDFFQLFAVPNDRIGNSK
jgi:hypothetical protein